jgi:hypothetical protein
MNIPTEIIITGIIYGYDEIKRKRLNAECPLKSKAVK